MALEQKTIIIVEDEPDTAEMFAEMLRLNGYRVLSSYGGAAAIALVSKEKADAVVLDLMMPDLSGLEVLAYMRRDPRLARIPVLIVSAKSLPSDVKQGLQAGASLYLTKPFKWNEGLWRGSKHHVCLSFALLLRSSYLLKFTPGWMKLRINCRSD
jgi:two-component system OmpR family response regulator